MHVSETVTQLLVQWREGDEQAKSKLLPVVYEEMRKLAHVYMRRERADHTLQPTALVHEAYLHLVKMQVSWNDRRHFFAVAARAMRRILVDHARTRASDRRGGGELTLPEGYAAESPVPDIDLLALDEALESLAEFDPRKCEIIELHYFGGLRYDEIGKALDISEATVDRELRFAKAWLLDRLKNRAAQ